MKDFELSAEELDSQLDELHASNEPAPGAGFCVNCGAPIEADALFCLHCGVHHPANPQPGTNSTIDSVPSEIMACCYAPIPPSQPLWTEHEAKRKARRKIIIGVIAAVVVIAAIVTIVVMLQR